MFLSFEKKIIAAFIVLTIGLISVLYLLSNSASNTQSTTEEIARTYQVLTLCDNVLLDALNIETGSRGFVLTEDESFLDPYNESVHVIIKNVTALATALNKEPTQVDMLDSLMITVTERLTYTTELIKKTRNSERAEIEIILKNGRGKDLTNRIRFIITQIYDEQLNILNQKKEEYQANLKSTKLIYKFFLVFIVSILIFVIVLIINNQRERNRFETDLTRSNKQLSQANTELESFSYSVSHDLRAPLRAINGYAQILHEDFTDKLNEDGHYALNAIKRNSKQMGDLIDDLLEYSRLGRKQINLVDVNMKDLVNSLIMDESSGLTNHKSRVIIHDLPVVAADHTLIRQVWINLISNAIKYSKNNAEPIIEIGANVEDSKINFFVKDNGVGFDMAYYNKLFGVFQRLHSHEEFEGTGIGLAIVHKIITHHDGVVWAESKLNQGTCFYFSLTNKKV